MGCAKLDRKNELVSGWVILDIRIQTSVYCEELLLLRQSRDLVKLTLKIDLLKNNLHYICYFIIHILFSCFRNIKSNKSYNTYGKSSCYYSYFCLFLGL